MKIKTQTENQPMELPVDFEMRPAAMEDIEAAAALFNLCSLDEIGVESFTESEIKSGWQTKGFDLNQDTRVIISPEGKIVAYHEVWIIDNPPVHPRIWGRVHPEYRGMGLGTALMTRSLARANDALERVPRDVRVSARSGCIGGHKPTHELYEDFGFKLIRHGIQMQIELKEAPPKPDIPEGIEIRVYRHPEELEAVYRADIDGFRDHFGFVEQPFEEDFERFSHYFTNDEAFSPDLWYLAMDGDEIAGISLNRKWSFEDKDAGYIEALSVRKPWRKRGIATALLLQSFGEFYRRGRKRVALHADASNLTGAVRLYEKVGMQIFRHYDWFEVELQAGKEISTVTLKD